MGVRENLSGKRFGRLVVLSFMGMSKSGHSSKWSCACDCGSEVIVLRKSLISMRTKSCGCLKRQLADTHSVKHGESRKNAVSDEFAIWTGILSRCTNPNRKAYSKYGGRGIKICERWRDFSAFLEDMGRRPSKSHSIERIDNDGDYEPSNCKWATSSEQSRNRRSNIKVDVNGNQMVLKDAANHYGKPYKTVHARIKMGWPIMDALLKPLRGSL